MTTNWALTVFHASKFGLASGLTICSGNVAWSIGCRNTDRAKSLVMMALSLIVPPSPTSGVTAIVTGLKLEPA